MKILVLSFYYEPDLCAGSFRTTALVNELKKHEGVDIEVVTTLPNRYSSYSANAPQFEKQDKLKIHRIELPNHKSGMFDQIKAFFCFYRQASKISKDSKYDLVFATSSRLFTAFLGARLSRQKNVPLYLDIRDIFVDTINDVLNAKLVFLVKPILNWFEKYTFESAGHINLVSAGFDSYFQKRYSHKPYTHFTNGIDNDFLTYDEAANEPNKSQLVNIIYAGNIGQGQGLHIIVPLLAKHIDSGFQITIIGDGGAKKLLEEACVGLDNVKLLPPVSREKLKSIYQSADILFLHLNDYQAFEKVLPSKVFEYGASGKPILAGVAGYAASFIRTELENAEVFSPNSVEQALVALKCLKLKTIARKGFVQKYSRQSIVSDMTNDIIKFGDSRG